MKKVLLFIGAIGLSGCSQIDHLNYLVNESTASIQENTCTIQQSTYVILQNAALVNESTEALIRNQQQLAEAKKESANDSETEKVEEVDIDVEDNSGK